MDARKRLDRACERHAGRRGDRLDEGAPHPPAGARHDQPHISHDTPCNCARV